MGNRKLLIIILILLVILPTALATILEEGKSVEKSGKNIKLVSVGSDKVVVDVDGISSIISLGKTKYVNGATIEVFEIESDFAPKTADIVITVNQECGDNVCGGDETKTTCCRDCGCSSDLACTDNQCINAKDNECTKNSDCNDNNLSTADICSGLPRKCSNEEIACEQDANCDDQDGTTQDTCINKICSFALYSDLAECKINEDCNDNITCTKDRCQGLPLKCINEEITSCESHDDCCPPTCSYPDDLNCKGIKESDNEFDDLEIKEGIQKENITGEEVKTEEKTGFFKKIINWFFNLFTT